MNNLKKIRKERNLTQKEVAKFIGISQNNYSYWENEKVKIDNESLKKLASYFGVSVDHILGRDTEKKNDDKKDFEDRLSALGISKEKASKLTEKDLTLIYAYVKGLLDGKN